MRCATNRGRHAHQPVADGSCGPHSVTCITRSVRRVSRSALGHPSEAAMVARPGFSPNFGASQEWHCQKSTPPFCGDSERVSLVNKVKHCENVRRPSSVVISRSWILISFAMELDWNKTSAQRKPLGDSVLVAHGSPLGLNFPPLD